MSPLEVVANASFAVCAGEASRDQGVNFILRDTSHIQEMIHSHVFTHQQPEKNHPWVLFIFFLILLFLKIILEAQYPLI